MNDLFSRKKNINVFGVKKKRHYLKTSERYLMLKSVMTVNTKNRLACYDSHRIK